MSIHLPFRFLAATILAAFFSSPGSADPISPAPGLGQQVQVDRALIAEEITAEQRSALYGTYPLRPGIYQIRPAGTQGCLGRSGGLGIGAYEISYLELTSCAAPPATAPDPSVRTIYAIMPHPSGGYTIRPIPSAAIGWFDYCATVARGVVLGPKRIDDRSCTRRDGGEGRRGDYDPQWVYVGFAEDQRFYFKADESNNFEINSRINGITECWAMRGDSTGWRTDTILWPCNGKNSQRFQLIPVETSWPQNTEWPTLSAQGWFWSVHANEVSPDGWRRRDTVQGVDIPGNDMVAKESIADNGAQCSEICHTRRVCRAWTWTAQGYNGNATPMCWIKNAISRPINRGTNNPNIFSGIIRP